MKRASSSVSEFGDLAVGMGEVCVMQCYSGQHLRRYSTWSLGREAGALTSVFFFSLPCILGYLPTWACGIWWCSAEREQLILAVMQVQVEVQ